MDNTTYTLTQNITWETNNVCLNLIGNNSIFNGNGYTINSNYTNSGPATSALYLTGNNWTIYNYSSNGCYRGVRVASSNNYIYNTNFINASLINGRGIVVDTGGRLSNTFRNIIINGATLSNILDYGSNSIYDNISVNSTALTGLQFQIGSNNTFKNSIIIASQSVIALYTANSNHTFYNNIFIGNKLFELSSQVTSGNLFYNNLFNISNMTIYNNLNFFNTTKSTQVNIIGNPSFGGNYWTNSSGTGYSDTCVDIDTDGFCDSTFIIKDENNTDYLPLSNKYQQDIIPPEINITYPTNNQIITGSQDIVLNYTVSDENLDSCWFNLIKSDGTYDIENTTVLNCENTTFSSNTYGTFNLTIYANDTTGNINFSIVNISILQPQIFYVGSGGSIIQIDIDTCSESYYHILKNGVDFYKIELLIDKLESKGIYTNKIDLKNIYLDNFDKNCNPLIHRTSQAKILCKDVYSFVKNYSINYTKDMKKMFLEIESEKLQVTQKTINDYLTSYNKLCILDGVYGMPLEEHKPVISLEIIPKELKDIFDQPENYIFIIPFIVIIIFIIIYLILHSLKKRRVRFYE